MFNLVKNFGAECPDASRPGLRRMAASLIFFLCLTILASVLLTRVFSPIGDAAIAELQKREERQSAKVPAPSPRPQASAALAR